MLTWGTLTSAAYQAHAEDPENGKVKRSIEAGLRNVRC